MMQDAIDSDNMSLRAASAWVDCVELQNIQDIPQDDFKELRSFWYMGWYAGLNQPQQP